jgi:hypothetical protein
MHIGILNTDPDPATKMNTGSFPYPDSIPDPQAWFFYHFNGRIIYFFSFRLADEKKEEGNGLYKLKNYREALQKYSEAIGKKISDIK